MDTARDFFGRSPLWTDFYFIFMAVMTRLEARQLGSVQCVNLAGLQKPGLYSLETF